MFAANTPPKMGKYNALADKTRHKGEQLYVHNISFATNHNYSKTGDWTVTYVLICCIFSLSETSTVSQIASAFFRAFSIRFIS